MLEVLLRRQGEAHCPWALREVRDDARKLLRSGTDLAQRRQLDKLSRIAACGTTFEAVARELHAIKSSGWCPRYAVRWVERMEKDLFPWIGSLPLKEATAPLLLQTLRRIGSRGANETAHTLRKTAGQVFRYGIATGRCERNRPARCIAPGGRQAHGGIARCSQSQRTDACDCGV